MQRWPHIRSKPLADFRIFKVRSDVKLSPRTGKEHDFFVLEAPNWVNVVAVTPRDELVMVEQYRVGSDTVELEVPGGVMDPGETDPLVTGPRELREETGYAGGPPRLLGKVFSNPAILTNTTFTVLIEGCELKHATDFDSGEDIRTHLVPLAEIPALLRSGRIGHPLVHVALSHYLLLRGESGDGK
ncbi:MAG: NUDIX hydrolase [Verrucomicrobia bacterium]|nr:NUDIX hydrolase [Verrucomicrobiota bacterium]